jgi:hypothetical protein
LLNFGIAEREWQQLSEGDENQLNTGMIRKFVQHDVFNSIIGRSAKSFATTPGERLLKWKLNNLGQATD